MADQKHHVTDEHFAGFGMIVNVFAEIETLLDEMIVAITKADPVFIVPLLTFLSMKNKRDPRPSKLDAGASPTDRWHPAPRLREHHPARI